MPGYQEALAFLQKMDGPPPEIGLVLGSGLGGFGERVEAALRVPYADIPGFPRSTVPGHAGEWIMGEKSGKRVAVMSGRFHGYEGWGMEDVVLPIRVMRGLGVRTLIVTNAAGGVNLDYLPGHLMIIRDHINFTGKNPLIGPNDDALGPRFPDMSRAYDGELRMIAREAAKNLIPDLHEGVYCQMNGPSFETPAEIRMLRLLGADAVGMSTVPEVIAARHMGMRVLGLSLITNCAAGVLDAPLSHAEVMETGERVKPLFMQYMENILGML